MTHNLPKNLPNPRVSTDQNSRAPASSLIAMILLLKKFPTKTIRSIRSARAHKKEIDPMLFVTADNVARAKSDGVAASLLSSRFIWPKLLATVCPEEKNKMENI